METDYHKGGGVKTETGRHVENLRKVERRRHSRYCISDKVIAFLDNIPCRILDMSHGGVAVKFIMNGELPGQQPVLDILLSEQRLYLKNIPCTIVSEVIDMNEPQPNFFTLIRFGISFANLSDEHRTQVDKILMNHTTGAA